jgi:F0F1-type ATP synthase assembly protein I
MLESRRQMQDKTQKEVQESNSDVFQNAFSLRVVAKMALQIAVVVGGMIVGAVFLGKYLDGVFGTAPWLTAILALGSTFPAFYITYKLGTRAIAQSEPDFERWKQKRSVAPVLKT